MRHTHAVGHLRRERTVLLRCAENWEARARAEEPGDTRDRYLARAAENRAEAEALEAAARTLQGAA